MLQIRRDSTPEVRWGWIMKVKMKGCTNAKSFVIRDSLATQALKKPF
jgi:hypothetical protein